MNQAVDKLLRKFSDTATSLDDVLENGYIASHIIAKEEDQKESKFIRNMCSEDCWDKSLNLYENRNPSISYLE